MRFRWLNRMYAKVMRYFWLPCPLCGKEFGGHEWLIGYHLPCTVPTGPSRGEGICPDCTRAGKGQSDPIPLRKAPKCDDQNCGCHGV